MCPSSKKKTKKRHFGPLRLPPVWPEDFNDKHKALIYVDPGMNTEAVIVECLRNNTILCQDDVPRDLLEEFGILIDISPVTDLTLYMCLCDYEIMLWVCVCFPSF